MRAALAISLLAWGLACLILGTQFPVTAGWRTGLIVSGGFLLALGASVGILGRD